MARFLLVLVLVGCGRVAVDPILRDGGDVDDSPPRWTLVQTVASDTMPSPRLTLDPLGSQHLIVVAVQVDSSSISTVTDGSDCNSYTEIPTAHAINTDAGDQLQMFYAKNSCPGASVISIDSTTNVTVAAWEVAGLLTDDPFDTASALSTGPATTAPFGPSIKTNTDGEFVVSVAIVANSVSGIHPGNEFTNDHLANGNAWAHLTDPNAPAGIHQAAWDQPRMPGTYCASAAAFKVTP